MDKLQAYLNFLMANFNTGVSLVDTVGDYGLTMEHRSTIHVAPCLIVFLEDGYQRVRIFKGESCESLPCEIRTVIF